MISHFNAATLVSSWSLRNWIVSAFTVAWWSNAYAPSVIGDPWVIVVVVCCCDCKMGGSATPPLLIETGDSGRLASTGKLLSPCCFGWPAALSMSFCVGVAPGPFGFCPCANVDSWFNSGELISLIGGFAWSFEECLVGTEFAVGVGEGAAGLVFPSTPDFWELGRSSVDCAGDGSDCTTFNRSLLVLVAAD